MLSKESVGEPNGVLGHVDLEDQNGEAATAPIAVVGMACRLPGQVSSLEAFWEFCLAARNAWTEIPQERLNTAAFYHPDPEKSGTVNLYCVKHDRMRSSPFRSSTSREPTFSKRALQHLMRRSLI